MVVSSGVMILVRGSILPFLLGSLSRGLIFVLEGDDQILSVAFPEKEGAQQVPHVGVCPVLAECVGWVEFTLQNRKVFVTWTS